MKAIKKRDLVRRPSLASHLKPGESIVLEDGEDPLVVTRRTREQWSSARIEKKLGEICADSPALDCQAMLEDLRG